MTVFHRARVHTHAGPRAEANALAVAAGRLIGIGRGEDLTGAFPRGRHIDLRGLHVFPGMIDAHLHFVSYGFGVLQVELRETRSIADAVRLVAAHARTLPAGAWAFGRGWDKNVWTDDRFPTRHDLDAEVGEHPVALSSKDGHLVWVNTPALRLAGVTHRTPDPPGGAIGRDQAGEPDGILREEAKALISRATPHATAEMREQAALAASADFHRLGLTGVHAFTGSSDEGPVQFEALQRLRDRGELAVRVTATVPDGLLAAAAEAGLRTGVGDAMLRVGALKIFADGTLGSQTASMLEPFTEQPGNIGIRVRSPEEIDDLVRRANAAGFWCAIHAIGDRANRDVLDIFERHVAFSHRAGARHRIEHAQVLRPDDVPRFARLGVVASMQPIHATADRDIAERYWGNRARWSYAWQSLTQHGVLLAFGSDAPVETPDPWRGLYAAVTREREGEPDGRSWYPDECLTLEQAFKAYTVGAAYAAGTEAVQGTLEAGKVADFIVLDRDPYAGAPDDLLRLNVLATVVDGRVRYAAGPLAGLKGD